MTFKVSSAASTQVGQRAESSGRGGLRQINRRSNVTETQPTAGLVS